MGFLKTQKERKEDAEVVRAAVQTLLASMTSQACFDCGVVCVSRLVNFILRRQGENGERSVDVAAISTYAQVCRAVLFSVLML